MKALANKTLQQRVENYIRKVNEVGNYKYIDGYTKASDKVRAIHLACGNEIYVRIDYSVKDGNYEYKNSLAVEI